MKIVLVSILAGLFLVACKGKDGESPAQPAPLSPTPFKATGFSSYSGVSECEKLRSGTPLVKMEVSQMTLSSTYQEFKQGQGILLTFKGIEKPFLLEVDGSLDAKKDVLRQANTQVSQLANGSKVVLLGCESSSPKNARAIQNLSISKNYFPQTLADGTESDVAGIVSIVGVEK